MITVKRKIKLSRESHGRRRVEAATPTAVEVEPGRIPRISRLMAVAIRLERMLRAGEVADLTELARLGHVTQPRMSQILNLTLLAPDIQEDGVGVALPEVIGRGQPVGRREFGDGAGVEGGVDAVE